MSAIASTNAVSSPSVLPAASGTASRSTPSETRCGKCKTALPAAAEPVEVHNEREFDALVRDATNPVVVDFWAPWCGPCRMVAPELARVAAANAGRLVVVKVNTDEVPELGERFRIRSIPTMAVFRGGKEIARTSGAMPAAQHRSVRERRGRSRNRSVAHGSSGPINHARVTKSPSADVLSRQFGAFVLERYPFACVAALEAFEASGARRRTGRSGTRGGAPGVPAGAARAR